MGSPQVDQTDDLELLSLIGFDGRTIHGLKAHPNGEHILYPLGCKVAVVHWDSRKQDFLEGHTNVITALSISMDGKYVASGQINHMGFKAFVIIWDFDTRTALMKHDIHKVRVEALDFSFDSTYLFSLGGRDDGNVVVTHIPSLEPMCGYPATRATAGDALTLKHSNLRSSVFMSAGEGSLRVWQVNPEKRFVRAVDVQVSKIKRNVYCVTIDTQDEFAYCGTLTGDILKVALYFPEDTNKTEPVRTPNMTVCLGKIPKSKKRNAEAERYSLGVRDIIILDGLNGVRNLVVGAGNGVVELVKENENNFKGLKSPSYPLLSVLKSTSVDSAVTSLQRFRDQEIMVGNDLCEIYLINICTFNVRLIVTCHTSCIYDIAFPKNYAEVFATASKDDIRVWHTETCRELLRISVPNFTCSTVKFSADGKSIISGWNDGCIRSFTPQSGKLMYTIPNAHNKGVTALDLTSDGSTIVSGGGEGQVRIWKISSSLHKLSAILKDHKGPVSDIHVSSNNQQAVSASTDGSCIIWDIVRLVRLQILFANSLFMACRFNPDGCQVLTAGTDRKIQYWECYDGSLIRDLEGSTAAALNTLDISLDGSFFVTGSNDFLVKVWNYNEGYTTHIGIGHAGIITTVRLSPDSKYLISVSDDGAIFTWKCPFQSTVVEPGPDTSIVCAVGSEKLDVAQPISSATKDRIRIRKSTSGALGFGSGDCAKEENIVSLSRTQSACSYRSTIDVCDKPPEIENEPSEVMKPSSVRSNEVYTRGSSAMRNAIDNKSSGIICQSNQPAVPPNSKLMQSAGKISSDPCVPKSSLTRFPTAVKSETCKGQTMKKPNHRH
ncbi:cilia- and flagella-associated protein 52 isoform X1 [Frankliniella occidentalis]|uniref:Cilia- and flagella-associated protein 52 n=2 Tax=Frankliniella occidentalis TaxID=133901 RepID=A0A6J1S8W3_FRAOC|nr:cilia- and flagella-associated protein 52 isoform X1 [Frankliniella occidentalis]